MNVALASSVPLARGEAIGRYVVIGLVGRGAMGDVYSAHDPNLNRRVAIKLLRIRRGGTVGASDGKSRLMREAQAIAKLSHPGVVVVHDVGPYKDGVFIAMEFVEGGTLTFWMHAQPRDWTEILPVFLAAGRGLQHAHEANLVHRDFKPDNVMVRKDGQVRVMDFGLVRYVDVVDDDEAAPPAQSDLAYDNTLDLSRPQQAQSLRAATGQKPITRLTQTGTMLGTPAYMAPEQFIGGTVDARTDQFAFCVALYEALFGTRPFEGANLRDLHNNVLDGRIKAIPRGTRVPRGIAGVLRRGLSVAPAERYPSMADLLAELEANASPARWSAMTAAAASLLRWVRLAR